MMPRKHNSAIFSFLALSLTMFSASVAFSQQPPRAEGEPVDATHYSAEFDVRQESVQGLGSDGQPRTFATQRRIAIVPPSYRSPTLAGNFLAQWMYLNLNGQIVTFWGARAVSLDPQSPLRALGMRSGDVITRMDGIPIWNEMSRANGAWQIPELERHFGGTEVRFILQGTNRVRVGQIVLDTNDGDNGFPIQP